MAVTGSSSKTPARGTSVRGKGRDKASAIEIPDDSPVEVGSASEEEDEFEEVEIPGAGVATPDGLSSVAGPSTVATPDADGLDTSMMSVEDNNEDFDEDEEEQVISVEIGGETQEEKEKRIALALRNKGNSTQSTDCQARLLSLLPHPLQAAFVIPPKRFPDKAQRSRLFFDALQSLVTWWSQAFFDVSDTTSGLRTRTWDEVQEVIDTLPKLTKRDFQSGTFAGQSTLGKKGKGKKKDEEVDPIIDALTQEYGGERVRSVNSLMKKALQQEGSRDMSAQLFVALARACGLGARLVVSLQPVPWRAEKVVQKKKSKTGAGKGGRSLASRQGNGSEASEDEDEFEEVPIPSAGSSSKRQKRTFGGGQRRAANPNDLYRLRPQRPAPQKLGTSKSKKKTKEVYSRSDQRWIPVDPVAGIIRKKAHYEPTSDSGPVRMIYVVGFEEDGYARDVTLRYAKNFGAKTAKLRPPSKSGEPDWWSGMVSMLQRPIHLNRDDLEDAEFELSQSSEGMPMHLSGFKDHPIFVLERHLKREEVLQPKRECGRFRGEPVYRRKHVLACRTAENWIRVGRVVKKDAKPLKWVKQRAVTLQKRRAMQAAVEEGFEPLQQGLYAEYQTELYVPPPIENTGFEFKKQRAIPVLTGIVVAAENEDAVLEAYEESAAAAEERERQRREDAALKRWSKLINGLRVRLRLRAEYGSADNKQDNDRFNPMAKAPSTPTGPNVPRTAASILQMAGRDDASKWQDRAGLSPSPEEEMEEVKVEAEPELPAVDEAVKVVDFADQPTEETASTLHYTLTPRTRSQPSLQRLAQFDIMLRFNSPAATPAKNTRGTAKSARGKAKANGRTRGRKRKASESEEEAEESDVEPAPKRRGRAPPPAPAEGVRRSLRSRAPKDAEQQRKEEEKRARLRAALASDDEAEDED
ncbi:hypothetical protein A1Q2_07686 [Trichosporon asahii var. asahii CBS 8904]|uniref:Xeroderma pigmentosum group C-complementing protein n=1 Tax=Trichosporon asahii var. asahii (strain CBS 8904) TaxID=1220162 RepID=K1V273_TRIAC|nr:hypothetical protein A1Q2_07686 [Trichosporon asahii var. asahii CBS 8904]